MNRISFYIFFILIGFLSYQSAIAQSCGPNYNYADIKAILDGNGCAGCHGASGNWNYSTYAGMLSDGNCGNDVVPGDAASSLLIDKIDGDGVQACGSHMPFSAPSPGGIPAADLAAITAWINAGALELCPPPPPNVLLNELSPDSGMSDGINDGIVELINVGAAPEDISCFVISNGEWTVTIPDGTIIAPGDVFIIACSEDAANQGLTCARCDFPGLVLDLDVCSCTGCFDNANDNFTLDNESSTDGDQVVLFNDAGTIQDAVMWTTGSHPTGGNDAEVPISTTPPTPGGCTPPASVSLPAATDPAYTQIPNLIRGCNTSYSRVLGNTDTGAAASWISDNHPTPGEQNNELSHMFAADNTDLCGPAAVVLTAEVYNYQHVQPTMTDIDGKFGSYVRDEAGVLQNWQTVVADGAGTTTLTYTTGVLPVGTHTFVLQWDDYTEGCCGSTSPTSGNECYERTEITVVVSDPLASTGLTAISCPTDFPVGQVDLGSLTTGGTNVLYEIFDNGISQGTSTTGIFTVPTSFVGPITATATNGVVGCGLDVINFTIDNNCRLEPPCPMITASDALVNGMACGGSGACVYDQGETPFISEIRYDSDESNEGVEITGPAGMSLSAFTLTHYNGSNGAPISSPDLSAVSIGGSGCAYGSVFIPISLQNGNDALALHDGTSLLEFLSYEGAFTGVGGIADGVMATDVGVVMANGDAANVSLQLTDGGWVGPVISSLGSLNANLTLTASIPPAAPCTPCPGDIITLSADGTDLPGGGTIDFYMTTSSTDGMAYSASTAGDLIASIDIPAAGSVPCDPSGGIILNEIGRRPTSGNGGGGGEYVELKNTSCATADIGCMVISDGDWSIVIPPGTMLASGDFYVLAASASVANADYIGHDGVNPNPTSSGSNSASNIINLTDGGEQIVLFDNAGVLADAIEWGGGQSLPSTQTLATVAGCTTTSVTLPALAGGDYATGPTGAVGEAISVGEDGMLASLVETPGEENFVPTTPTIFPVMWTIPESLCNQGTQYIRGIINPFIDGVPTDCDEIDATSSTAEFEFSVSCPTVALSGNVASCSAPAQINLDFTAGTDGADFDVTLVNTLDGSTTMISLTAVTIPSTELLDVTATGEYEIQSVVEVGGCPAIATGDASVAISDAAQIDVTTTPGALCGGGDGEVIFSFAGAELPVDFVYMDPGGASVTVTATADPYILLTSTPGAYTVTSAVDGLGCPVTIGPAANLAAPTDCTNSICGTVWYDGLVGGGGTSDNGILETGEPGVAGIVVNLYSANGTIIGTTTTASDGTYCFENLPPNDYYVEFEYPTGVTGAPLQSGNAMGSDADPSTNAAGPDGAGFTSDDIPGGTTGTITITGVCFVNCVTNGIDAGLVGPMTDLTLPVELVSFQAVKQNEEALLKWITATEINSDYFLVERSANGILFETLGSVSAAGNSTLAIDYSFTDRNPIIGVNYYRLKLVDQDGDYSYSQVEAVKFVSDNLTLSIRPNLVSTKTTLTINQILTADAQVEILDMLGRKVMDTTIAKGSFETEVDVQLLAPGQYIVRLTAGKQILTSRMVKVNP